MEGQSNKVNNAFYEELGEGWYEALSHPIALLRAENAARNPWISQTIQKVLGSEQKVLDIGCGAGFLTNTLAEQSHRVTGIDLSAGSLAVAKKRDVTQTVRYLELDASALPFPDQSFDVVCAMDFLEHIDRPEQIIKEAARLLKPNGLFFFHTFNRHWLSWLIVIKGVEWCVPNTPANMHLYRFFIKPEELHTWCQKTGLVVKELHGFCPKFRSAAFWKSLIKRTVDPKMEFCFTKSLVTGYLGFAQRV
jgi:2-polyprenyl-6-hydroxyphenyl methylase/3-demethylubiquinone-9 3-methyltransferase